LQLFITHQGSHPAMRILFVLIALFLPAAAGAQVPDCIPGLYGAQFPGSKTEPGTRGDAGWYAYGWCTNSDGSPREVYLLCAHGECVPWDQIGMRFRDLAVAAVRSSKREAFGEWFAANQSYTCRGPQAEQTLRPDTPRGRACAELVTLMERDKPAYTPPQPPPTYTHKVKPNGTAPDRPVYTLKPDGARVLANGRATVGQPCDTSRPTAPSTGDDVWAEFGPAFEPGKVALCAKQ
jgi:hypothetical protein